MEVTFNTFCNHHLISLTPARFSCEDQVRNCVPQYHAAFQKVENLYGYLVCELEYNIQPDVTKSEGPYDVAGQLR